MNIIGKTQYSLIIVVGLPCSGKTTLCHKYFEDYILYDDFISNFYDHNLINDLEKKKKIIITDPRLCDFKRFTEYLSVFLKYLRNDQILLILLPNNKKKSLENCHLYRQNRHLDHSIKYFAKVYNISLFFSQNIDIYFLNKDNFT